MNTTGRQFSSSSAPEAQPSEAGFTLVEVSVAVAVGVLCMLVLGQALSSAAGSSESIVRQAEMLKKLGIKTTKSVPREFKKVLEDPTSEKL